MKKRFRAIIFDLGGVLSVNRKFRAGVHSLVARKLRVSIDQYIDSIDETYAAAISGKISKLEALKTMSRNLDTTPKNLEKIFKRAYRKNFRRDKSLYRLALSLRKKGYEISIISDIWYVAKEALIDKSYYRDFNSVVTSCEVGSRKTDKKIFQFAIKQLNVSPKEVLFTDNRKWNLTAPKKLGITSIHYKNKKQFIKELKKLKII